MLTHNYRAARYNVSENVTLYFVDKTHIFIKKNTKLTS